MGVPYSPTGPCPQLPRTFLRVKGPQAIQHGRRKRRRQWNSEFESVLRKNRRFGRAASQVNEDFLAPHRAQPSQRSRSGKKWWLEASDGHFLDQKSSHVDRVRFDQSCSTHWVELGTALKFKFGRGVGEKFKFLDPWPRRQIYVVAGGMAPWGSMVGVARGDDSENPNLTQFCERIWRFWRGAPQVNEDFFRVP